MIMWVVCACAAGLLLFSDSVMRAASAAAELFVSGVMPALFPMMVLVRMAPMGAGGRKMLWQSTILSFLSGSPASAQRVQLLRESGYLEVRDTEWMLALTGVMSPMFFLGTLARWCSLHPLQAWTMLLIHWLSAAAAALIWRSFSGSISPSLDSKAPPGRCSLPAAIAQAAQSLLAVCGAMMLFAILAAVLQKAASLLWTGAAQAPFFSILWAFLEIGGGAAAVIHAWPKPPLALLCGLCGFGGLSIWLQNLMFAGTCVRPVKLLGMRALHGAIAYGLGLLLL